MASDIILQSLKIKQFKGIKNLNINFSPETDIYGENGVGKTTIFDAFYFLLFSKDSKDRTKFDVQPLDNEGNKIHHLETELEGILKVDGQEITIRKIFKEKWSKTRGKAKTEFKGYETLHYINDVPQKESEYKKYVDSLIDESTFKLITNPMYFPELNWKKRREILIPITGDVDTKDVINYNDKLKPLEGVLNNGIDNFIKAIKEKIKRYEKDREQIPHRIDELTNAIEEHDYKELTSKREEIQIKIDSLDEQIADKGKAGDILISKREELFDLKTELQDKIHRAKEEALKPRNKLNEEVYKTKNEIDELARELEGIDKKILDSNVAISKKNEELNLLRSEYKKIKARELNIDESKFICPTCERDLPKENIEEQKKVMEENFNIIKASDLKDNKRQGMSVVNEIKSFEEKIISWKKDEVEFTSKLNSLKEILLTKQKELKEFSISNVIVPGKKNLEEKIKALGAEIEAFNTEDTTTLKEEKKQLQIKLMEIDKLLATEEINNKNKNRIAELEDLEKELSSKIAKLEGQEILAEEFIRTKVELLEEKVNSKFKYVKFKMFKDQINGGLEECCEPLVGGVPFTSNLNTAAKINAGIDIINTLSRFYGVRAPIFIDNRESVNKLIETDSQIINLFVSEDKELRIENKINILKEASKIAKQLEKNK